MGGPRYASVEDGTIELVEAAHTDDRRIMLGSSPEIEEGAQARILGGDGAKQQQRRSFVAEEGRMKTEKCW
jgi:hypothetical protein